MPAAKAGLKAGDQILSVDGLALHSVDAMLAFLQQGNGRPIHLTALRDGKTFQIELQPVMADAGDRHKLYRIGFAPNVPPFKIQQLPLPAAVNQSVHFNLRYSGLILEVLHRMVARRFAVQDLSGPIGTARETGLAVEQPGWQPIIGLMSIISLNLGIFNLLPIPILDGGVIVLLLIEGVMRRDLDQEFQGADLPGCLCRPADLRCLRDVQRHLQAAGLLQAQAVRVKRSGGTCCFFNRSANSHPPLN